MATDGVGGDGWVRYGVGGMCACRFRVGNAEVEDYWIENKQQGVVWKAFWCVQCSGMDRRNGWMNEPASVLEPRLGG